MKKPVPFGKYLLIDRVNVGGMAEVYKAKATGVEGFERLLAIKRILPNIAEDDEFITMFIDEAKISVQLQHANIAQIYDLGKIADSYFIAMEYISGKDVKAIFDRMRRRGEILPIPMTCYIVGRLCEGLDYAHRKKDAAGRDLNIVHRDISPQNVLVSFEGEVKVIDFGIAKAANKASRTQAGILKGKFGYMSPEQVRGLPLDRRSDVFAVGVCLYEMLTGERLFVGESDFSTLEKVRNVDVVPPSTYNRRIDDKLEGIVMKALAKDVDDRYQWCNDLQDALQRFLITSDSIFSRQDLSSFMKSAFAEDLEREKVRNQAALSASLGQDVDVDIDLEEDEPAAPAAAADRTEVFNPGAGPGAAGGTDPGYGPPGVAPGTSPVTQPGVAPGTHPGAYPPAAAGPPGAYPGYGAPAATPGYPPGAPGTQPGYPHPSGDGTQPGVSPAPHPADPYHGSTQPRAPMPMPAMPPAPVPGSQPLGADSIGGVPRLPDPGPPSGVSPALRPIAVPEELRTVAEGRRPIEEKRGGKPPKMERQTRKSGAGRAILLAMAFVVVLGAGGGVAWWMTQNAASAQTGSLIIRGTPRRAAVFLNDQPTGTIPFIDSRRAVGVYNIRVEHDGYEPFATTTTVGAGQTATVDVTLQKAGGGVSTVLVVPVPLDAQVILDGNLVKDGGNAPWRSTEIEADKAHTVVVRKLGYREQTYEWTPVAGAEKTITAQLMPASGTLVILSEPGDAEVTVDGEDRGTTPVTLEEIDTSRSLQVEVEKEGCYEPWSQTVTFGPTDSEKTVTATLLEKENCGKTAPRKTPRDRGRRSGRSGSSGSGARTTDTQPAGKGLLRLNAKPTWANVTIDGRSTGRRTPLINYELPAGKHTIVLEAADGRRKTVTVNIVADQVTTEIVNLQ
ncbi:MAG: serine/threonine protein kinase [Deltaproteobacteria bacterium]|nr:serine/threonine protein kinase [Deltaproteobacteria bacterium]